MTHILYTTARPDNRFLFFLTILIKILNLSIDIGIL